MLPASSPSLLVLILLQGSPLGAPTPSSSACEDNQRIELSLARTTVVQEICVSSGIMTGFFFDMPAVVELQDEVRFVEVLRGRSAIGFVPPPDMALGERLRLTARWGEGPSQQSVTFTLVAHRGQATRQVEVYRDRRPRESYQHEVEQERAKNQQLREENQQLRTRLERAGRLQGLHASGALGERGVKALLLKVPVGQRKDGALQATRGISYRSDTTVAVDLWVMNASTEPWLAAGASMVTATGEKLEGITVGQDDAIPPTQTQRVFVEANAAPEVPRGDVTLSLWDERGRTISIPRVAFPTFP